MLRKNILNKICFFGGFPDRKNTFDARRGERNFFAEKVKAEISARKHLKIVDFQVRKFENKYLKGYTNEVQLLSRLYSEEQGKRS